MHSPMAGTRSSYHFASTIYSRIVRVSFTLRQGTGDFSARNPSFYIGLYIRSCAEGKLHLAVVEPLEIWVATRLVHLLFFQYNKLFSC